MITLTTPAQINSILGGSAPVGYNKLVLTPFQMDPVALTITGTLRLTSSGAPDMQPILGRLNIRSDGSTAVLEIEVGQLDFYRRIRLEGAQNTAALTIITNAQNAIEVGLINLGVIAGVQGTGA
jgi:hypothetical protein